MPNVLKAPKLFDEPKFRSFVGDFKNQVNLKEDILIDLTETQWASLACLTLIEILIKWAESLEIKVTLKYRTEGIWDLLTNIFKKTDKIIVEKLFNKEMVRFTACQNSNETLEYSNKVIGILSDKMDASKDLTMAISWIVAELTDNAGVHGYLCYKDENFPNAVFVSANNFSDRIGIVIGDMGIGIVNSLKKHGNEKIRALPGREIIQKCIEEGVTGHPQGSPGFGLFGASELIKRANGKMYILSRKYYLEISNGKIYSGITDEFPGTLISIEIPKSSKIELNDIISTVMTEHLEDLF